MATAVKDRPTEAATAAAAKPFEVSPTSVTIELGGHKRRWLTVFLPEGMTADDVRSPGIWRRVQGQHEKALSRYDRMDIYTHGDAQLIEAVVIKGEPAAAHLKILKVTDFADPDQTYYQDDVYKVTFETGAFWVRRKSDNKLMSHGHTTEQLAVRALNALYPQKVGT